MYSLGMAGSYHHCCNDDGSFRTSTFYDMIENLGDAYEACEEMYWMIAFLSGGDKGKIAQAQRVIAEEKANAGF